jgi:hypothetical protein
MKDSCSDMINLLEHIKCPCCDLFFVESLRPHLLNCGHQICSDCISLNKAHHTCLICGREFTKNELNETIINYINDEVINKLSQMKLIDLSNNSLYPTKGEKNILYCLNCNTLLYVAKIHLKYFPKHNIIDLEKYYDQVNSKLILQKLETNEIKDEIETRFSQINFSLNLKLENKTNLASEKYREELIERDRESDKSEILKTENIEQESK